MKRILLLIFISAVVLWAGAQSISTVAGGNGSGSNRNQFNDPLSVYLDAQGNIYECELYGARVMKFPANSDSTTDGVIVAGGNGSGQHHNQFNYPTGIFLDASGNLYVADEYNDRVLKFPSGSDSATNGIVVAANHFNKPSAVFVDASGYLYVADEYNSRIRKFPPNSDSSTYGVTVAGGNGTGSSLNQFNIPDGLFLDADGNIYVADQYNNRVLKFPSNSDSTINGVVVAGGNGAGSAANQLNMPTGVFLDAAGNMYVADYYNNRIQKFPANSNSATNGVTVAGGNGSGSALNQLNHPAGIFVDHYENIYIADQYNNRILKYASGINNIAAVEGKMDLLVYPNPNNGNFTLQFADAGDVMRDVEITDAIGRVVMPSARVLKEQQFNLEQLAAGIYVARIHQQGQVQSLKFSVVR